MKAPTKAILSVNPEFLATLAALPGKMPGDVIHQNPPKPKHDIQAAGVGEPVQINDKETGAVDYGLVARLNRSMVQLENGLRFSRKAGRWANSPDNKTNLFATLVDGFEYQKEIAQPNCRKMIGHLTEERLEVSPEIRRARVNHLRNRIHFWFDAIFQKVERISHGKGKKEIKGLRFTYEIVRGPFNGFHRQFWIPLIGEMEDAHAFILKAFEAEGLQLEDKDQIDIKFMMDNLGGRPVRMENPASNHRLKPPTDLKFTDDNWILTRLQWEMNDDGEAWEPEEELRSHHPEY